MSLSTNEPPLGVSLSPTKPPQKPPRKESAPLTASPKKSAPNSPLAPRRNTVVAPPSGSKTNLLGPMTSSGSSIVVSKNPFSLSSERLNKVHPIDLAIEPYHDDLRDPRMKKKRSESICVVASSSSFEDESPISALPRSNSEPFFHSWDICPVFDLPPDLNRDVPPVTERKPSTESFFSPEEESIEGKEEVGDVTYTTAAGSQHKVVFSATPDALMRLLIQPSDLVRDSEFVDTFVITHGYFIDAGTFVDEMIYKFFHMEEELGLDKPQQSKAIGFLFYLEDEENDKKKEASQLRIINVLKRWLRFNVQSLEKEPHIKVQFERFVSDLIVGEGAISKWSEALTRALQREKEPVAAQKVDSKKPAKKKEKKSFIDFNPVAIAQQLTLMEFDRFKKINTRELLFKHFQDPNTSPALHDCIQYFNKLSMWVSSEIVSTPNIRQRGSLLSRFIEFAQALRKLNNFNSLMSVMSALQHSAITRLKQTWKLISPKHLQIYEQLCDLASLDGNHGAYRLAIQRASPPYIPYQGLYLKDLTFIEEKPTVMDNDHINFGKLNHLAKIVSSVQHAQEVPYKNLNTDPSIQALLEDLTVLDEATIYQLSRSIEARQTSAMPDALVVATMKKERDDRKKLRSKSKDDKDKQRNKSQKSKRSLEDIDDLVVTSNPLSPVASPPLSPRGENTRRTPQQLLLQMQLAERLAQSTTPRTLVARSNSVTNFKLKPFSTPTAQPPQQPTTALPTISITSSSPHQSPASNITKERKGSDDGDACAEPEKRRSRKSRELQAKLEEQIAINKNLEAQIEALQQSRAAMGENNLLKKEIIDLKEQLQKKEGEIRELKSKPNHASPKAGPPKTAAATRREAAEMKELKEKLSIESKMRFLIYEELKNIKKGLDTAATVPQCVAASASLEKMMQFFPLDSL
eukprot:TRINITY_DN2679_c0_g1_i1.p1 TRINITY_DN2679_c0_g1~~TRINITY_DN2679_c0_g1_i1.p1  ORF type:complete len:917 (-),score=231.43 TRINITY_DN2679_c0_g1_i1:139-2889(-)